MSTVIGETTSQQPPQSTTTRNQPPSVISRMKRDCFGFTVTVKEGFRYVKAFFVGQAKKLTAKNEREAAEADLQQSKMQVEATDEAESAKKRLDKTL